MTDLVLDTSVAVPLLVTSHVAHRAVSAVLGDRTAALAGHALHETYAVLTRLPGDARLAPRDAVRLMGARFETAVVLDSRSVRSAPAVLAAAGVSGGGYLRRVGRSRCAVGGSPARHPGSTSAGHVPPPGRAGRDDRLNSGGLATGVVRDVVDKYAEHTIEVLERAFPLRVVPYRLRRGSAGAGWSAGGEGIEPDLQMLEDVTV